MAEKDTTGTDADADTRTGLPTAVADEAERLTRRARDAVDEAERAAATDERDALLAEHGYVARVRDGGVLVCYPSEWVDEDGVVRTERIGDVGRAVERHLEGAGDTDDWEDVEAHNREIAAAVREEHGPVHGANASAFADFMGNHYARPFEAATERMREEFLTDYFVRNAWPSAEQRAVVEESVTLTLDLARSER